MIMKFDDLFEDKTKLGKKIKTDEYLSYGSHIIIDQGQEQIAGYTNYKDGLFTNVPAIVFGDHTRVIKYVDTPFFLGADGVKVLKCKLADINYKYLYYALLNAKIPNTGYNRHFKWLKRLNFHIPSIKKQEEIVHILDRLNNIMEAQNKQLSALDELIKSRFIEMFGDIVKNPMKWPKNLLGTICDVRDGTHDTPNYYQEGYPLVTSKNVTGGEIDFSTCSLICYDDLKKINERSKVNKGDILMPMIGTVGKPIIVRSDKEFAIKNLALIKFNKNSLVTNIYIKALLESDYFDKSVIGKVRGGTQQFISLKDMRNLEILVPPMELQKSFSNFIIKIDKTKSVIQRSINEIQLLLESLMQKYFR